MKECFASITLNKVQKSMQDDREDKDTALLTTDRLWHTVKHIQHITRRKREQSYHHNMEDFLASSTVTGCCRNRNRISVSIFFSQHRKSMHCGCKSLFDRSKVIYWNTDQVTRELVEAFEMNRRDTSVSCPYVSLSKKDIALMNTLIWAKFHRSGFFGQNRSAQHRLSLFADHYLLIGRESC